MNGKKKIEKIKLDQYHYHEALNRTFMVTQIFNEFVVDHPVVKKHKNVKKLIYHAGYNLGKAYQLIGQIAYKEKLKRIKNEILGKRV